MSTTYACGPYKGGIRDRQREFQILAKAFAFRGMADALDRCMPERTSTEYYGQGQSGYTAGRNAGDPALGIDGRNIGYPKGADVEHVLEEGDDERFYGAGGVPWPPDERTSKHEQPKKS